MHMDLWLVHDPTNMPCLDTTEEIKHRVYGKRQMWDFQNEKWADKNSLKQLYG